MASRRILLASGRFGPERVDPGYIVPVFVAVAKRKIGSIPKAAVISGIWSYEPKDALGRAMDWALDNRVAFSAVKLVTAYVVSYGGSRWGTSWNAGKRRRR